MLKPLLLLLVVMEGCDTFDSHAGAIAVGDTVVTGYFDSDPWEKGIVMNFYPDKSDFGKAYIRSIDGHKNQWIDNFTIFPYKSEWDSLPPKK